MSGRTRDVLRTRSGCRKCRERHVKCPEQRPICNHCRRLGFNCCYVVRLTWLGGTEAGRPGRRSLIRLRLDPVEAWMFLNTIQKDFDHDPASTSDASHDDGDCSISPKPRRVAPFVPSPTGHVKQASHSTPSKADHRTHILHRSLTQMQMSPVEGQLWSYFDQHMTPQCVLTPDCNPYRNVILRLAASSQRGPLFHCILAVAANQLHSIGLHQYQQNMWLHRAEALRELRGKVNAAATVGESIDYEDVAGIAQITASTLMLCFFEILQDCSQSWIVHTTFAQTYLDRCYNRSAMSAEYEQFHRFCTTYIHSHNILAATAGTEVGDHNAVDKFCTSADDATVLALAGCSTELLATISEINRLGTTKVDGQLQCFPPDDRRRRDHIERRLYSQGQILAASSTVLSEPEVSLIAEVKRLATLLYLYGRIDGASPQEHHMVRITQQILMLIPQISLRTNTILWPLFIVAVLGVRPECDEERKIILARLAALQETRQLGNVKKARRVIENVWRARDLRPSDAAKGWEILKGKHQTISLA